MNEFLLTFDGNDLFNDTYSHSFELTDDDFIDNENPKPERPPVAVVLKIIKRLVTSENTMKKSTERHVDNLISKMKVSFTWFPHEPRKGDFMSTTSKFHETVQNEYPQVFTISVDVRSLIFTK